MKKKTTKITLSMFKYLLIVPLLLLSFCQSNFEGFPLSTENRLTKDAKVLSLMKAAIKSDLNNISSKSSVNKSSVGKTVDEDDQCTHFLYPMVFEVYSGDDPVPDMREINSDEELISFIDAFSYSDTLIASTTNYEFYIFFPITLLDTDGVKTVLNDLTELEGTLQMAVDACASLNDDSSGDNDGSDDGSSGSDDGSDSGSDDGSDSGSDDGSDSGSDDVSDNGSDDGSDSGSDDSSNSGSDDGSDSGSDDGSDSGSDDGSDSGSDDVSDNGSDDVSDSGSDDDSDRGSDDGSNDGSDEVNNNENDNNGGNKYCDKKNKKVYICHKGKTICVSVNAIWGHMEHHEEDYLGSCDD